jgi:hypothetical protein
LKPLPQSSFLLMHRWPPWRRGDGHGDAPVPAKILQSKTSPLLFRPNQSHIQPLLLASSCLAPRPGAVGVGDAPSLDPLSVPQEKRAESGRRWPQVAGKSGGRSQAVGLRRQVAASSGSEPLWRSSRRGGSSAPRSLLPQQASWMAPSPSSPLQKWSSRAYFCPRRQALLLRQLSIGELRITLPHPGYTPLATLLQ